MHVTVNGASLYFDVEGAELVPDGPAMRTKPTVILLHGGPSADHSVYKPAMSQLCDIARVIFRSSGQRTWKQGFPQLSGRDHLPGAGDGRRR